MNKTRSSSIDPVPVRLAGLVLVAHSLYAVFVEGVHSTPDRSVSGNWNQFKRFYAEEELRPDMFIATVVATWVRKAKDEERRAHTFSIQREDAIRMRVLR